MCAATLNFPPNAMGKIWISAYPPGTPAEIDADAYPSLVAILEESCRRFAERPACSNLGVTISYQQLDQLSQHFAAYLLDVGLQRGDRVALMMPNVLHQRPNDHDRREGCRRDAVNDCVLIT